MRTARCRCFTIRFLRGRELVGVCTTSQESGRRAQEQAGFAFATTDYRDLMARDDIHIIDVCAPNDAHHNVLLDALRAGKHIYCDKPLALNVAECEEVCALARRFRRCSR